MTTIATRLALTLAFCCALVVVPVDARAAGGISQLRVTPSEGHVGNLIDLSGAGFPANSHLNILMACPTWQALNAVKLGNVVILSGPVTDSRGQFSGFLFRAIHLHELPQSTCQIQASVGDNAFGVDIPAVYLIRAKSQPQQLGPCK